MKRRTAMTVTTSLIKQLRTETGIGIGDCKSALERSNGDLEAAKLLLREEGRKLSAGTASGEGTVGHYIHHNGQIAAIVEINCQTDFTAKNSEFKDFANKVAMHIASTNPECISRDDVPADQVEKERSFLIDQAKAGGRPEHIIENRIIPGQMNRFYSQKCLLEQPFVMDESVKIEDMLVDLAAKFGETMSIKQFSRMKVGN